MKCDIIAYQRKCDIPFCVTEDDKIRMKNNISLEVRLSLHGIIGHAACLAQNWWVATADSLLHPLIFGFVGFFRMSNRFQKGRASLLLSKPPPFYVVFLN